MRRSLLLIGGLMLLTVFVLAKRIDEWSLDDGYQGVGSSSARKFSSGFPRLNQAEFTLDLPVLTYHYIREVESPDEDKLGFALSVTPADFREQMHYLSKNGYHTIAPAELLAALKSQQPLPLRSVLLTFDDGYQDFYDYAFPVLKEFNLKATVFVVTGFVGYHPSRYLSWPEVREIDASGSVTIASHSVSHDNLTKSSRQSYELTQSKKLLERELQHPVTTFAYPFGTFDDRLIKQVERAGYELAFTTKIGTTISYSDRFILPRVRVSGGLALTQFPSKLESIPQKRRGATVDAFEQPLLETN